MPHLHITPAHLVAFRRTFKLSQSAAAALVGRTRVTWCRWECGASPVPDYMTHTLTGLVQDLQSQPEEVEKA